MKINFEKLSTKLPIFEVEEYYTNGDILILKELCEEIPSGRLEYHNLNLNKIKKDNLEYKNYKEADEFGGKLQGKYKDLLEELKKNPEIKMYCATQHSPIKLMIGEKIAALIMPMQKELSIEEENALMVNDFEEYCDYKKLIPVEFEIKVGEWQNQGFFVPINMSDKNIIKMIRGRAKQLGGKWNGKFERCPHLLEKYKPMVQESLNKTEKDKLIEKMNDLISVK